MCTVKFTRQDCGLLACLPTPGCDLAGWIRAFTFTQRTAAPVFDEMAGCIRRAAVAGVILSSQSGFYQLAPLWESRREEFIAASGDTGYGAFDFAEWLEGQSLPGVETAGVALGHDEYQLALSRR
jgi:hypothetical protein